MAKLTKQVKVDSVTKSLIQHAQATTGVEDLVGGKVLLQLDEYANTSIPTDWDIEMPLHDILMVSYVDENASGEICRNGIWLKQEITNKLWRVGRVVKAGPRANPYLVNALIMFPSDKGIPISFGGKKYVFLNEERVFAVMKEPSK